MSSSEKGSSLPKVPCSFMLLLFVGAGLAVGLFWCYRLLHQTIELSGSAGIEVMRTSGGSLEVAALKKREELTKKLESWRGTSASIIRLDATYRYIINLRQEWRISVNEDTKTVFVISPPYQLQLPVAVDSKNMQVETASGWGRFDKWDLLEDLRKEVTPRLEAEGSSDSYRKLVQGDARKTLEEFVYDWLIKEKGWKRDGTNVIKVYFADETDIPFPGDLRIQDFLP